MLVRKLACPSKYVCKFKVPNCLPIPPPQSLKPSVAPTPTAHSSDLPILPHTSSTLCPELPSPCPDRKVGHGGPWSLVPESSCVASGSWGKQEPSPSASPRPRGGSAHAPAAAAGTPWTAVAPGWEGVVTRGKRPSTHSIPRMPTCPPFAQAPFPLCTRANLQRMRWLLVSTA